MPCNLNPNHILDEVFVKYLTVLFIGGGGLCTDPLVFIWCQEVFVVEEQEGFGDRCCRKDHFSSFLLLFIQK